MFPRYSDLGFVSRFLHTDTGSGAVPLHLLKGTPGKDPSRMRRRGRSPRTKGEGQGRRGVFDETGESDPVEGDVVKLPKPFPSLTQLSDGPPSTGPFSQSDGNRVSV